MTASLPNIAVILTDSSQKIIWVNEGFTTTTGYTLPEVFGKNPSLLQGPKSQKEAIARIRERLEEGVPFRDEIINYRKNGEKYLCKLVIHPVYGEGGKLTNYIAFEVDGEQVHDMETLPFFQLNGKYHSSGLKGTEELKLYYRLREIMESEKLYLDAELTLKSVSDRLATNTKYLSQVVNHHFRRNFQHFINYYRVADAKAKIAADEYRNLTLYGISRQCGFKNKSTFYKVFKEISGITPREYLKTRELSGTAP
jgi:PAS domain S-box-containing protein